VVGTNLDYHAAWTSLVLDHRTRPCTGMMLLFYQLGLRRLGKFVDSNLCRSATSNADVCSSIEAKCKRDSGN
jgi:hypothetical protein